MSILAGFIFGVFVTHNVEKTDLYLCKIEKQQTACEKLAQPKK